MGRRKRGLRILGPYRKGKRWQLVTISPGGSREVESFESRGQAEARKRAEQKVMGIGGLVENALEQYEQTRRREQDMLELSIKRHLDRVQHYVDPLEPLDSLRAPAIRKICDDRLSRLRKITVKKELESVKAFARFVYKRFPEYLSRYQLDQILEIGEGIKLRPGESRRKPQLTIDESLIKEMNWPARGGKISR